MKCGVIMTRLLPALLLIAPGPQAGKPAPPAGDSQDAQDYRISVNVDLVLLYATVRDQEGHLVSDLREQDFSVYEDGVPQRIRLFRREDTPVTVGLVVDHSRSMGPKLSDVVAAARVFVYSSNPQDEMFVVNFNENVSLGLPDGVRFTNRSSELEKAISQVGAAGQTALYDAVGAAIERVQTGGRDKKVLIVISDGGDNRSTSGLEHTLDLAGRSGALIYTIGIYDSQDPDKNPRVLRRLARATGGEAYFPAHHDEAVTICARIAQDIRSQYALGYFSTNTVRNGSYRAVRTVARAPGRGKLVVRTRAGYSAGGAPGPAPGKGVK